MLSLTSLLLCTTLAPAAEPDHPVVGMVKAAVPDPAKPFVLVVRVTVKDGAGPKFEQAFAKAAKESRKEKGNRVYELSRSTKNANEYQVYEHWENVAALAAHLKTAHFQEVAAALHDLTGGPPDISVWAAVGE
jgi:quinol monooxygenase YgiN